MLDSLCHHERTGSKLIVELSNDQSVIHAVSY